MICDYCGHSRDAHSISRAIGCARPNCNCNEYVAPGVLQTSEGQAALLEDQLEESLEEEDCPEPIGPQHTGRMLRVYTGETFKIKQVHPQALIVIEAGNETKYIREGYTTKDLVPLERQAIAHTDANIPALIEAECRALAELLIQKNRSYGNSFANPIGVFAKDLPADAQIRVRIDDKLNRLAKGTDELNEDTIQDLLGYLVLYRVLGKLESK